jgi:segregation and condensation protein A
MIEEVAYQIRIDVFEGPFGLLLKAIDDGQMDIYRVSISQITASYFEYWKQQEPPLLLASDFLVMAAYLVELKSRALLPVREEIVIEENLAEVEDSLVRHIQEYQVYKKLALELRQRKEVFEKIYARHEGEEEEKEIALVDVSLRDLVLAFKRVYDEAAGREKVVQIQAEEITLEDRIIEIKRLLAGRKDGLPFEDLFIRRTRLEIVVTFLAILELAKQRCIAIMQGRRFGSILVFAAEMLRPIVEEPFDGAIAS